MDLIIRQIDPQKDKNFILDCHCKINFECDSEWAIISGYDSYHKKWLSTNQPNSFFSDFEQSLNDERTLAIIAEIDKQLIGYMWVRYCDVPEYNMIIAEIEDIMVIPEYQRQGAATKLIEYAEKSCKTNGATILRSGTGSRNMVSISLHEKLGFKKYRIEMEKQINPDK